MHVPHQPPQRTQALTDRFFSFIENLRESDSLLFRIALVLFIGSLLWLIASTVGSSRSEVATRGGSFTEGVVGTPRFVNPVLAVTRADKDLVSITFDGLMILGKDSTLVPNVAESVTVSEDGLTYNVILRRDVTFHDGTPLTARDVVFTMERIQEPTLTSPLRAGFDGVRIEEIGEYELNLILPEPYAPFMENLTFGIIPEHIWKNVSNEEFPFSQRNSEPIGTGPFTVKKIVRTTSGIPETYILEPNTTYHRGEPKIETFTISFFPNEDALIAAFTAGEVDAVAGINQSRLTDLMINDATHETVHIPLPRTFAVFINQNKSSALREASAREALNISVDRHALIDTVLMGYGTPITTPLPHGFGIDTPEVPTPSEPLLDAGRAILRDAGWKLNSETGIWEKEIGGALTPLAFSIATVNNPTFEATAEFLSKTWSELGVSVTVKQFEQSDLTQAVIRPRDYETLLFGTQIGRSLDFYPFWHSSQRNDPGLNVSLYANITTDSILGEARTRTDTTVRTDALTRFSDEITKETPAIFLYQPELLYIFPTRVVETPLVGVSEAQERFASVHDWYIETESVWPFFK